VRVLSDGTVIVQTEPDAEACRATMRIKASAREDEPGRVFMSVRGPSVGPAGDDIVMREVYVYMTRADAVALVEALTRVGETAE